MSSQLERTLLDLADGGPLIPCRDAAHARRLAQLWLVMRGPPEDPTQGMRERIQRPAAAGVRQPPQGARARPHGDHEAD